MDTNQFEQAVNADSMKADWTSGLEIGDNWTVTSYGFPETNMDYIAWAEDMATKGLGDKKSDSGYVVHFNKVTEEDGKLKLGKKKVGVEGALSAGASFKFSDNKGPQ